MGKNARVQLPEPPTTAIVVHARYDKFFREKLLRAMRDDFERFPEGLPTYHNFLIDVVRRYAGDVTNSDGLSEKDLANFLKGIRSHAPRIAVMDAYIQIVRPEIRPSFFVTKYADHVGGTLSEYLELPWQDDVARTEKIKSLAGAYACIPRGPAEPGEEPPAGQRFLVMEPNASRSFLLCYEFNATPENADPDTRGYDLITGFIVPNPTLGMAVLRNYRFDERRVGHLYYGLETGDGRIHGRQLSILSSGEFRSGHRRSTIKRAGIDMKNIVLNKIYSESILSKLRKTLDNFRLVQYYD